MFPFKKKNTSTNVSAKQVSDYWFKHLEQLGVATAEEFDGYACWRCHQSASPEVCQIVSKSWNGSYQFSNLMVLCPACQADKPDLATAENIWNWLQSESNERYWEIQGMMEYEKRYQTTVLQELWLMGIRDGNEVEKLVVRAMNKVSINHLDLNGATLAGLYRDEIEKMSRKAFTNWKGLLQLAS